MITYKKIQVEDRTVFYREAGNTETQQSCCCTAFPAAATGGDDVWEEQTADLTAIPTDTHAVHFSFTGSGSANLFNWDWWQFNEFTSEIEATPSQLSTLNSQLSTPSKASPSLTPPRAFM